MTAFDVIEHVDNPVSFLRVIAKMLRPDGQKVIGTPNCNERLWRDRSVPFSGRGLPQVPPG